MDRHASSWGWSLPAANSGLFSVRLEQEEDRGDNGNAGEDNGTEVTKMAAAAEGDAGELAALP